MDIAHSSRKQALHSLPYHFIPPHFKLNPILNQPDGQNIKECYADFISSIEQNKLPISDIKAGYYSTNISLPAIISYKLGRGKEYLNGWSLPG